jgi:hypothetical protein
MAAAHEKGEASKSSRQLGSVMALEDLLQSLNLKGEDIAGILEVESLKKDTKWMTVMRLLSPKPL